ncbi:unnamed protein product [Caenorhabditis sp. 36 PRJEB53466]|nr:unnamed protein product [Caenorhabditis sp. 36 PRJEB53466]
MTRSADQPIFVDQSELFKSVATSIEQKHIRRHNEKPGVSRRDENRPSATFTAISNIIIPLASELFLFRKMLDEQAQDYIFATPSYSKMSSEEREEFDADVKERLAQFETFINQLGHRVNSSDGLRNATERSHLTRVHDGLRTYLKEAVDFVSVLKKEHLKRLQAKSRSLADQVKAAEKDGHVFMYHYGLDGLLTQSELQFSAKLGKKLDELRAKHSCVQFTLKRSESEERDYDLMEDAKNPSKEENKEEGWDAFDDLELEEVPEVRKPVLESRASPILFNETVRNRRRVTGFDPVQDEIRDSYERWKEEQGAQFTERFQQQTAIMKEEFVKSDRDDEIEKLEQQICEIQSLSTIMDQERDIDLINDLAIHTTENLVDGNEWIRKAITNAAFCRVILLFCIIVLSFTLLFLDWYNP